MTLRLAILAVALLASAVHADQWISPTPRTITSPNGRLQVVVQPAADHKSAPMATLGPKGKPGKTFALTTPWMPVDVVLFDDGTLLALDQWHQLGYGKVATLYERDGRVRWTKTLAELVGQPYIDTARHSVSSIWWRKMPLEWQLAQDGKSGLITLADENQLRLVLRDGSTRMVDVAKLPDDPDRLLHRARALAQRPGQEAAALPVLDRAIALDPEQFEAVLLYVQLVQRTNDHARVVALLDRISPRWKTKTGYGIANVCVAWAESLRALSRSPEAERVLKRAVQAAPTYTNPAIALATLHVDRGEQVKADAVLDAFVARLTKASYLDHFALTAVGDFYKQRKLLAKALAIYRRGWKPDQVTNQFLYDKLATLYEETGNLAEAIRVHEQLLAYYRQLGPPFARDAKETAGHIARLRAKRQP